MKVAIVQIFGTLAFCLQYSCGKVFPQSFVSSPSVISPDEVPEGAFPPNTTVNGSLLMVPVPQRSLVLLYELEILRKMSFPVYLHDGDERRLAFNHSTACHYEAKAVGHHSFGKAIVSICSGRIEGVLHLNSTHVGSIYPLGQDPAAGHRVDVYPSVTSDGDWSRLEEIYSRKLPANGPAWDLLQAERIVRANLPRLRHKRSTSNGYKRKFQLRTPMEKVATATGPFVIKMFVLADADFYRVMEFDINFVVTTVQHIYNYVNYEFRIFDVSVVVSGLEIWTEYSEQFNFTKPGTKSMLLGHLDKYDRSIMRNRDYNCIHLLHGEDKYLDNGKVSGAATFASMCSSKQCYFFTIAKPKHRTSTLVGMITAHELAHTLAVEHDDNTERRQKCKCPSDRASCIMHSNMNAINLSSMTWSNCTREEMRLFLDSRNARCVRASPDGDDWVTLPAAPRLPPSCGNGLVEAGEQCDCGGVHGCRGNLCCDPHNCRLFANATCAYGRCCDPNTCRPHSRGVVCRPAHGPCQLPEFCDGQSWRCPPDVHMRDGEKCAADSYCSHGRCPSALGSCRRIWGPEATVANAACFAPNTGHGVPKHDLSNREIEKLVFGCYFIFEMGGMHLHQVELKSTFKCNSAADAFCGRLFCHSNRAKSLLQVPQYVFDFKKAGHHCKGVITSSGIYDQGPGVVKDGSSCPLGMCYLTKCRKLEEVLARAPAKYTCYNGGTLNSKGNCHCPVGHAPPDCRQPGYGGSVDSGPANDTLGLGYAGSSVGGGTVAAIVLSALALLLLSAGSVLAFMFRQPLLEKLQHLNCSVSMRMPKVAKYQAGRCQPGRPPAPGTQGNNSCSHREPADTQRRLLSNGTARSGASLQIDKPQLVSSTYTDQLVDRTTVQPHIREPNLPTLLPTLPQQQQQQQQQAPTSVRRQPSNLTSPPPKASPLPSSQVYQQRQQQQQPTVSTRQQQQQQQPTVSTRQQQQKPAVAPKPRLQQLQQQQRQQQAAAAVSHSIT